MTTLINDCLTRQSKFEDARKRWEDLWQDVADYTDPMSSLAFEIGKNGNDTTQRADYGASSQRGARRRYDTTAVTSAQRLTAGIESLVTPQSEKWHALAAKDPLAQEPNRAEEEYFDRVRDYMFNVRYDARSGFHTANQAALASTVRYGTGIVLPEESFGIDGKSVKEMPIRYRYIPLPEAYISLNQYGEPDTLNRKFSLTARAMVQKFGNKVHPKVMEWSTHPTMMDHSFPILHVVAPREEKGSKASGSDKRAFASYYIDITHKHLISDSGFYEFPYAIYYWHNDGLSGYGESPITSILDDIRGLNYTIFQVKTAMAKKISPAFFVANDGVMNRPNLNPNKMNIGRFDANGRLQFQTVTPDVSLAELAQMIEAERSVVKEGLHQNLFNILTQNPGMTATEALLRSNEKADLLGPSGARLQRGLSNMVDIELSILARHGAFAQGATLEAPQTVMDKDVGVRFTSPIDRLRKAQEALGAQNLLQVVGLLAKMGKTSALDRVDEDEIMDIVREAQGVPRRVFREDEEVEASRQQGAQMQQFGQVATLAEQAGKAGNELLPALAGLGSLGIQQPA